MLVDPSLELAGKPWLVHRSQPPLQLLAGCLAWCCILQTAVEQLALHWPFGDSLDCLLNADVELVRVWGPGTHQQTWWSCDDPNLKSAPLWCKWPHWDSHTELDVIVQDEICNLAWQMMLGHYHLDQLVQDGAVGIGQVRPEHCQVSLVLWVTTPMCSKHSCTPDKPQFCTEALVQPLLEKKSISRHSCRKSSKEMILNWSIPFESSSIVTPSANCHCCTTFTLLQMIFGIFHSHFIYKGQSTQTRGWTRSCCLHNALNLFQEWLSTVNSLLVGDASIRTALTQTAILGIKYLWIIRGNGEIYVAFELLNATSQWGEQPTINSIYLQCTGMEEDTYW